MLILFTPQVNGIELDASGLSTNDWFLTTDFQNMTFDGNFNYLIKGTPRNILFREIRNQDVTLNGLDFNFLEYQLYDQETGISLGTNESIRYTGIAAGYFYEENPFDNPPYKGGAFSNSEFLLSNFDPNLQLSQIAEFTFTIEETYPFTDTPVDNGTHYLGTYRGWSNISVSKNFNFHMLYNGSSTLNINGNNLEVYTYTIYKDMYPSSGYEYSEGYCDTSVDCMAYSDSEINETGSFVWAKWYNFGNLTEEYYVNSNSTTFWSIRNKYFVNGTLKSSELISYPLTIFHGKKMIIRYSPELNYVVQAFGEGTNTLYPYFYEVREFKVVDYVPETSAFKTTITQNITIIEHETITTNFVPTTETTTIFVPTTETTTKTEEAPFPWMYSLILLPILSRMMRRRKSFD